MLNGLAARLKHSVDALSAAPQRLGLPELVAEAAVESERLFQTCARTLPAQGAASAAALAFVQGEKLGEDQLGCIAGVLCDPVREKWRALPVGHPGLSGLLDTYRDRLAAQQLKRLTWYGLLTSYLRFSPVTASTTEKAGWVALRAFLQSTWPGVDAQSGEVVVPDWVRVLRGNPALLGGEATAHYAADYARGQEEAVGWVTASLGIPDTSWFWPALHLQAAQHAGTWDDETFVAAMPRLLARIQDRPALGDEALLALLVRQQACRESPPPTGLLEYLVGKNVWRNPKLRGRGVATPWDRAAEPLWRAALQWVHHRMLRDFFSVLVDSRHGDAGRLEFWSGYRRQIVWTRLILGADTVWEASGNPAIRELMEREDGLYGRWHGEPPINALMLQIGEHLIVEFSDASTWAYVYPMGQLAFDRHAAEYGAGRPDIRYGDTEGLSARIVRDAAWQEATRMNLMLLGIYPDSIARPRQEAGAAGDPSASATASGNQSQFSAPPV